jgi:hypothetical protein
MRDEQGWHATDCQPIVSRRSIRVRQIHKRVKTLRILVGATGFEPATPCAQGRCATRLRYAPTRKTSIIPHTVEAGFVGGGNPAEVGERPFLASDPGAQTGASGGWAPDLKVRRYRAGVVSDTVAEPENPGYARASVGPPQP